MSRSGYVDDPEGINLWRGTVERSLRGRRGQTFLKELAKQMDAMPEKRLIAGDLISPNGECCAIGVVCKSRDIDTSNVDVEDRDMVAALVDISPAMAAEIEYMNDEWSHSESPEDRWKRMRAWVDEQIVKSTEGE